MIVKNLTFNLSKKMNKKITKSRKSSSIPAVQKEKDVGSVEKESFFTRVKKSLSKRKRLIATLGSVAAIGALKHTLDMKKISDLNEKIEGVKKIFQQRKEIKYFFKNNDLMANFFYWTSQLGLSEKRSVVILVELLIEFVFKEIGTENKNMSYIMNYNNLCTFNDQKNCALLTYIKTKYGNINFINIRYTEFGNSISFTIPKGVKTFVLQEDFSLFEKIILHDIENYFINFYTLYPNRIFNDHILFESFFSMGEMKKYQNIFAFVKGVVDFCKRKNIDDNLYNEFNEFLTNPTGYSTFVNITDHTLELYDNAFFNAFVNAAFFNRQKLQQINKETFSEKNIEIKNKK